MTPKTTDDPPQRYGRGINLLAIAIVLAIVVVGYGLAHPREIALPFAIDAKAVDVRGERDRLPTPVAPSSAAHRGRDRTLGAAERP